MPKADCRLSIAGLAIVGLASGLSIGGVPIGSPIGRVPSGLSIAGSPAVVVELYTSEGCSSCPPADALLSKIAREGTVGGAQVIPLGFHVTYWDQLGWKDSASLPEATKRQEDYSRVFGADRVYTPQAIVDGGAEMVGSDEGAVRRAIAKAAGQPHVGVTVSAAFGRQDISVDYQIEPYRFDPRNPPDVWVILTEDALTSFVKRGENVGHTLHNDAVVRRISGVPESLSDGGVVGPLRPEWHPDHMHAVVLVQDHKTRRILGAAIAALTR